MRKESDEQINSLDKVIRRDSQFEFQSSCRVLDTVFRQIPKVDAHLRLGEFDIVHAALERMPGRRCGRGRGGRLPLESASI